MKGELEALRELTDTILTASKGGEESAGYMKAVDQGIMATQQTMLLLEALRNGDQATVQAQLTEFEDVNRTLEAIGKMDRAISDAENAVQLEDVLKVIKTVVGVGITIATLV